MDLTFQTPDAARHPRHFPQQPDPRDAAFVEMLAAYRSSGGLARAAEVAAALRQGRGGGAVLLARWIAAGRLVHFEWNDELWLPLFQFQRPGMHPMPAVWRVVDVLAPVLDPWDTALWFVRTSEWLGGDRPVDRIVVAAVQVERAARADRCAFAN